MNQARLFSLQFGYSYTYNLSNLLVLTVPRSLSQLDNRYYCTYPRVLVPPLALDPGHSRTKRHLS
jgi:hypothetical protein